MRLRSVALTALLAIVISLAPGCAGAHEMPKEDPDRTVVFGLTATQLVIAAAVGAWLGGSAALATRRASLGAGLGLLAAVYVAHLAVEALVVGGVYYFWPGDQPTDDSGAVAPGEGSVRISGLGFATGSQHATP